VERDDALRLALGSLRCPHDATVRDLFLDLRFPGAAGLEHLGSPGDLGLVVLIDALDTLGEVREILELGPLVVGHRDRDADVDRFLDVDRLRRATLAAALATEKAFRLVGDILLQGAHRRAGRSLAAQHALGAFAESGHLS
jgi:hypothetical protein